MKLFENRLQRLFNILLFKNYFICFLKIILPISRWRYANLIDGVIKQFCFLNWLIKSEQVYCF